MNVHSGSHVLALAAFVVYLPSVAASAYNLNFMHMIV